MLIIINEKNYFYSSIFEKEKKKKLINIRDMLYNKIKFYDYSISSNHNET